MPRAKISVKTASKKTVFKKQKKEKSLEFKRLYTSKGIDPLDVVEYETRSCRIVNPDGTLVFEMKDIEVPKAWSKVASDVLISKYLRKGGVPQVDKFDNLLKNKDGSVRMGTETSVKQVIRRMAGCWRWWGEKNGYFASRQDAQVFEDEVKHMLIHQIGAPNSPQWFNTGLALSYNIKGPAQGHWYADSKTGKLKQSEDAYTHPQPHACFIQSVNDDLVNKNGIFDLIVREARIFKYGSGSGTNFSNLRGEGEPLSGGGTSSGLMSWLQIFDRAAGAIKSGGTTRRAAKMVVLNIDHPDIEAFISWKHHEEEKAASLIASGYSAGFEGEAFQSVSGQNSNNSVRISDDFMHSVENNADWHLRFRTNPEIISKTVKARDLWDLVAKSAHSCGDPGIQFDTTVNDWHTCLSSGRINASNPCSEFMFLDDSSCNLASMNLMKFYREKEGDFDIESFKHATRIWSVILEISVLMAQFPSYEIAKNSYLYRPLGLGYANLGALLMVMGLPYDSEKGRAVAAAITALMTGEAYATSAEMAKSLGTFSMYEKNKQDMLRVIRNHRRAAYGAQDKDYENLSVIPKTIDEITCPDYLLQAAREAWDKALVDGGQHGFKNAQVTLLAPTGTIGLVMDCDTTGVEPDYALVKFKKLAGGGYFKIINQSVPLALRKLNYSKEETKAIIDYIVGASNLGNAPHINRPTLLQKGFSEEEIDLIEKKLPGAFEIRQIFNVATISKQTLNRIGINDEKIAGKDFDLLGELGFSREQIIEANDFVCGRMTLEGAPMLKDEHLPIFDCANKCGQYGKRYISPYGHIEMMGAVQPFLSGAISKTVNLPNESSVEDIENIHLQSWKKGIKAVAIYRDGSKISQPLNVSKKDKEEKEIQKEVIIEYRPVHRKLPKERMSITRKVKIGGHKMFFTVGLYNDGKPGEIFITMNQQGSFAAGMADSFAKMASIGLQYGVPIETIVGQLRHMRFQPMGFTGDSDIQNVSSISDFIGQWFERKFLNGGVHAMKLPFEETQITTPKAENESTIKPEVSSKTDKPITIFSEELGFSGEMCPECGSSSMVQNGKCHKCVNCGATTGCS
jgi:ribonucleoside-diphosphate reductase alpha chain